jgi:DNA-binding transcriptional MerR regulator
VGERSYLSIGDVLALLRDEFPDITISKIRFLESRGLLVPERTPSGYRKFYDHDVERLRWILRQQREHFLPLKVIKGRLEGAETASQPESLFDPAEQPPSELVTPARSNLSAMPLGNGSPHPSTGGRTGELAPSPTRVATMQRAAELSSDTAYDDARELASARAPAADAGPSRHRHLSASADLSSQATVPAPASAAPSPLSGSGGGSRPSPVRQHAHAAAAASSDEGAPTVEAAAAAPAGGSASLAAPTSPGGQIAQGSGTHTGAHTRPTTPTGSEEASISADAETAKRAPVAAAGATGATGAASAAAVTSALAGANLTAGELAQASGLTLAQVEELESFGLIEGRGVAGVHCYDEEALVVAGLAASFARFGIEARHLKIFKHAAERQAGLYSQVIAPLLRQRNPEARARANDDLLKMAELGPSIMTCFTRAALRDLTGR